MAMNEIIKSARLARGWSMEDLAREISKAERLSKPLAWQTVQQWEKDGGTAPKRARLETVAQLLGLSVAQLMGHEKPPSMEVDLDMHPELEPVRVVKLKLQAGMSGFAVEPDSAEAAPIFFRSDWLRQRGFKPYHLLAVKINGQSMETTLYKDDVVVINTAETEPKDGEVFAVNFEGESVVKRLVRNEGAWWLSSDNPDQRRYPKKVCDDQCFIIGRVIHRQSERI